MDNRFNLIDEPWIPVENNGLRSLNEVLSNKSFLRLNCRVLDKISLLKFLLAIGQSAYTPKDDDDWLKLGVDSFINHIKTYLKKHHDKFYLYGDNPFLQYPCIDKLSTKSKSFGNFVPNVSTGNSTVVTQWQIERKLSNAEKALLLLRQMSMSFSGKKVDNSVVLTSGYKGKKGSGKIGPGVGFKGFLHSFYLGDSIIETIYINLFTTKDLQALPMFKKIGTAPWEVMPSGEDDSVARDLKESLIGRLIPLSRFCYLSDDYIKLTEGISHLDYKDGMNDPSVCIVKTDKAKDLKAIWATPEKKPWRQIEALLSFLNVSSSSTGCMQLRLPIERIKLLDKPFSIWSGGIQLTSNSGEQYLTGSDDEVQSEILLPQPSVQSDCWFAKFCQIIDCINKQSYSLKTNIGGYLESFSNKNDGIKEQAENEFWKNVDVYSQNIIDDCFSNKPNVESIYKNQFFKLALNIYDKFCPSNTSRQMKEWIKHRFVGKEK